MVARAAAGGNTRDQEPDRRGPRCVRPVIGYETSVATDATTMVLDGDIDIHAVRALTPRLNAAAGAQDGGDLIIDLTGVTFLDSTGVGALLQTHRRLARQGRRCALIVPPGSEVAVLLSLTGLDRLLRVFPPGAEVEFGR
jgi:anti-anti-sigma factor